MKKLNFVATLPLKSPKRIRITKKEWKTLVEDKRDIYDYSWSDHIEYLRIDIIDNPCIDRLRKTLIKQRVTFKEFIAGDIIIFTTKDVI